jgi:Thiamine pyrophosphate-requiring enzymes [acetolactate synthase, pyruvate dehydrogenase (cytochrome), glyoxylate carboligase, phosphonopyruvate decarboxylase]
MSLIRVSDYLVQRLVDAGISDVFLVTGGGAMHLNDAFGNHEKIRFHCFHHEQACAIAAEGYFRASGRLPVVNVTTGPGGTNAITGVLGQWLDSIPAIYISGNVKWETTIRSCPDLQLRQLGDQEADIISIVSPIVKYASMLTDAEMVKYEIDKALYIATHGRPGPVWIDVPLNIQGAFVDPENCKDYNAEENCPGYNTEIISKQIDALIGQLQKAQSPLLMVGVGIRLAKCEEKLSELYTRYHIPVLTGISGHDLIESDSPYFFGMPGICGDRMGNLAVQNCDLLLVLGTRLGLRQTTYNYTDFARNAYKVMVDVDRAELEKPTLQLDLKIESDLDLFLNLLLKKLATQSQLPNYEEWNQWGQRVRTKLPGVITDNPSSDGFISSYLFTERLFDLLPDNSVVVTGNGTAYTCTYQAMKIKKGMRVFANQGCASMGYDLPAAIGASIAGNKSETILVTGDGSIMMNLQELQTIAANNLPIKIFLLENEGYVAIRTTQTSFFNKRFVGESPRSGLHLPDFKKVAEAFGIKFIRTNEEKTLDATIREVLNEQAPVFCEIKMNPDQTLFPKVASYKTEDGRMVSKPMEEMFPFVDEVLLNSLSFAKDLSATR